MLHGHNLRGARISQELRAVLDPNTYLSTLRSLPTYLRHLPCGCTYVPTLAGSDRKSDARPETSD